MFLELAYIFISQQIHRKVRKDIFILLFRIGELGGVRITLVFRIGEIYYGFQRVSNMLGHSDSSMTLQMYAKYRKRENVKRASFLGNI